MTQQLVLASSSPYRRELLARLRIPFDFQAPSIDERQLEGEAPEALVQRLAEEKARRVAEENPTAWIIGADQLVRCGDQILGKSGNADTARQQLEAMQGRSVELLNGLCLLSPSGQARVELIPYRVDLRSLTSEEIARYIEKEQPFDCAGSLRAEGLGITLIERMVGEDPNAIIGLPLIRLSTMLRAAGFSLP